MHRAKGIIAQALVSIPFPARQSVAAAVCDATVAAQSAAAGYTLKKVRPFNCFF